MKVAVVGAGITGASAARHLAHRGHDVTLFERFPIGHSQGSSHGRSRIVRRAYPDAFYTACMEHAYPMWAELDRAAGGGILHECGLLYFGKADSPTLQSVLEGLRDLNVPFETVDAASVSGVFPALRMSPDEIGVFTAEAGWVSADLAVRASVTLAQARGAQLIQKRIDDLDELGTRFDRFVLCMGAWTPRLVPIPVWVTLQTFGYVDTGGAPIAGPVWIEDGAVGFYGFPSEPGSTTLKVGVHQRGPKVDPDDADRTPSAATVQLIHHLAEERFGLVGPQLREATGCLYTNTDSEDFLLGHVSEKGFFASACTGHGFKFGPWIGKLLADFVEGKDSPERYPRFFLPT